MVPSPPETAPDAALVRLNAAWPILPAPIKTAILAIVDAAGATAQTSATDAPRQPLSRSCARHGQAHQSREEVPRGKGA